MIDYCIKMPEKEEYEKGHKYPYYSCEILCSINGLNVEKLLHTHIEDNDNIEKENDNSIDDENMEKDDKNMKIEKEEKNKNNVNINNTDDNKKEGEKNENEEDENSEKREYLEEPENNEKEEKKQNEKKKKEKEDEEYEVDAKALKDKKYELNISLVHLVFDHLFSFLNKKTSLDNYVLMGYFNKITNYLIKTKTKIILDYIIIYRETVISQLLSHINRYSIANIFTNMLNALSEDNTPDANEKYMMIVNKLLEQFILNENDNNTIEIICELIINCIVYNNKIKLSKVIDANIINKFDKIIQKYYENFEENKNKILSIINLLTKMNKSILASFSNKITSTKNSDDNKNEMINLIKLADKSTNQFTSLNNSRFDFKELVYKAFLNNYSNYCNSIKNICITIINNLLQQKQNIQNNIKEIEFSFSPKKLKIFGIGKIILFEFIITVLDIYINCLAIFSEDGQKKELINEKIILLLNTHIFDLMIKYYFKFKNNNFLSNIILDLVKIIFDNDKASEELILKFLQLYNQNQDINDNNFISLLINDIIKNTKFIFENSNNGMNSLLLGSNISILNYIFSCKNNCMKNIFATMKKEKFFYDNLVININDKFSKRLYKNDDYTERPQFDLLGIRIGSANITKGNSDIPFSLESLNDQINFYIKVYEKFLAGEDYMLLFKERENKLEEIKNSNEYLRLGNQSKDEESETEEDDEYEDENIPKPMFFNSKLDVKKEDNVNKDIHNNKKEDIPKPMFFNSKLDAKKEDNVNAKKDNVNKDINNNKNEESEMENEKYNDVNFWQPEIKDERMDEILKELL